MAFTNLNLGSAPNDGTGSNLRAGGGILNANFALLSASGGSGEIGHIDTGAGAVATTVSAALRRIGVVAFDYFSAAQRTDVSSYTGALDVTSALNAAVTACPDGAVLLLPPGKYKTTGWTIAKKIDIMGIGVCMAGAIPSGAWLTSTSNSQIMVLNAATQNKWQRVENIGIIGTTTAGTAQHGLQINNTAAVVRDVVIRECGGTGMVVTSSYGGHYERIISYSNTGAGFLEQGSVGANTWISCHAGANGGHGWDLTVMDGSDTYYDCYAENNTGRGLHVGAAVNGCVAHGWYSEGNTAGSMLFDATSTENRWHCKSLGFSETMPTDNGTNNKWTGRANGIAIVEPKLIQSVTTTYTAVVTASPNVIPYDDTIPQSSEGMTIMTRVITPRHIGNIIKVRVWGHGGVAAGSVMSAALFLDAETDARAAVGVAVASVNTPLLFQFEYSMTAASVSGHTFAVNLGSSSAGAVTFGGVSAGRKFGGITIGGITVEEYLP